MNSDQALAREHVLVAARAVLAALAAAGGTLGPPSPVEALEASLRGRKEPIYLGWMIGASCS